MQVVRAAMGLALGVAAFGLSACAVDGGEDPNLANLVIQDPSFDFSTSGPVSLVLTPAAASTGAQAVEVSDAEGRRLLKGAFAGPVTLDLKLPVGAQPQLTLRLGSGSDVTVQQVNVDANGRAVATY